MKKLFVIVMLMLGLMLVACGGQTTEPAAEAPAEDAQADGEEMEEEGSDSAEVASDAETVVIDWWHIWANEPAIADTLQSLAHEFMAENPNVDIQITTYENEAFKQKMTTVMQSGEPPDLFQTWGGGVLAVYADAGMVKDLSPALEQDGWADSIAESALNLTVVDGKHYGVPWRINLAGMWYNKELFEQAGLDPESPPETWSELLDAVEALKAAGITPIALGEGEKWPGMFWYAMLLSRVASPEEIVAAANRTGGAFDSPGFVEAGAKLQELIALEPFQEGYLGMGYGDAESLFANGQAGMELMGNWAYGSATGSMAEDVDAYNEFVGWFPFPAVEGGEGEATALFGGGDNFAVGINAEPETIEFLRFLTSAEASQRLIDAGAIAFPIVDGTEANYPNPVYENIETAINEGTFFLNFLDQQFRPPLDSAVNDEVQALFAGMVSPEDVAANLEATAAENLD